VTPEWRSAQAIDSSLFPKNWGEPTGEPAIFEKQIGIKLLHPASALESRIQALIKISKPQCLSNAHGISASVLKKLVSFSIFASIGQIEKQIDELKQVLLALKRLSNACCGGDKSAEYCSIIEALEHEDPV
jgi:hypothetical protein